ncbi:MAG TPA: RecQ family ATP-dependent DNA helicase [Thermoanaerobaculia bacterium]|nr:RecQ family ATP-dependent DNA helicase [Thermoanaerobaculia bacterium]
MVQEFLQRCLLLDLETSRAERISEARILKIGALYRGRCFEWHGNAALADALARLDEFASGADFVLGHNVLAHDLPILAGSAPRLALLGKPAIDTLLLSPLAFPENPYHRLVKGYKLVRDAASDPVADARLAGELFSDEWRSFARRAANEPAELAFYAFCFGALRGLAGVFSLHAGRPAMDVREAGEYLATSLHGEVCGPALARLAASGLARPEDRPAWAFAAAWLRVAGGSSVVPRWVAEQHPSAVGLLDALRCRPCPGLGCDYCRTRHDLEGRLRRFFDFAEFRRLPQAPGGGSLQRELVDRSLQGRPLLAILPTGGGKSLCYQLPALIRHDQRGLLTIVISPLQALMQDQVEQLNHRLRADRAAAVNGLLTPPERGAVAEKVRLGEVAILYVSPEQLRNRSFRNTIEQREIGAWVFDEAHCLSKWGHDFRPDYLYASRFIRELAAHQRRPVPPIACYTATAKPDVRAGIVQHFKGELGIDLEELGGNLRRQELAFAVESVPAPAKLPRILRALRAQQAEGTGSAAVVYFSTRAGAERAACSLADNGMPAVAFHAGIRPPDKRRIVEEFVRGDLRVVCATNAFGMGIDKKDVRLVVHADVPGSLESYLQEAGRAGRDGRSARCLLLFSQPDVERQFKLAAESRLSRRDINQILRGLRRLADPRRGRGAGDGDPKVVVTSGELLADEEVETSFDAGDRGADTKVKTAVAWLERAKLVERHQNHTRVFQGRPLVATLEEAARRIDLIKPPLSAFRRTLWLAILSAIFNCEPDQGLTADQLAELPPCKPAKQGEEDGEEEESEDKEKAGEKVLRILHQMAELRLIESGMRLTAYVRPGGKRSSPAVFEEVCALEREILATLAAELPEAGDGHPVALSLRWLNQLVLDRLPGGAPRSHPNDLRRLLLSLSREGKARPGRPGSLELISRSRQHHDLRLDSGWQEIDELSRRRQEIASRVLTALIGRAPSASSGAVLVEFGIAELIAALAQDLRPGPGIDEPLPAVERALLFLHEQKVIQLQHGLAVFRQAMTIRILRGKEAKEKRRTYTKRDFLDLGDHYAERTFQIHVMARYAELGLTDGQRALELVDDYFELDKRSLIQRHFAGEAAMLARATGRESFRAVVESLNNQSQIALVTVPVEANLLVLAGPGAGKTRVVVHRCAYLLRVERVPAHAILVVCFNRSAAREIACRLRRLVGDDARGVIVQTYHGLALRLTGRSLSAACQGGGEPDFASLIDDANEILRDAAGGEGGEGGEGGDGGEETALRDPLRERLLAGFSHILVDEYQDINSAQYELVSNLAGRTVQEAERKLAILAVGDDDQTIYGFNGAKVAFLQRFREDYSAAVHYLVENFRSSAHIIDCANRLIRHNPGRMKHDHPIRVDDARARQPAGGRWTALDTAGRGRVLLLTVADAPGQAAAAVGRLGELRRLDDELFAWRDCAILARTRRELEPIRALCESQEIPVTWCADREQLPPLHRVREISACLESLAARGTSGCRASELLAELAGCAAADGLRANPWTSMLHELLAEWRDETGDEEAAPGEVVDFLYDALAERRREPARGDGVYLGTVHAAKGLEFTHVVIADGGWMTRGDADDEDERRLFYVGMTRARETLTLLHRRDEHNPHLRLLQRGAACPLQDCLPDALPPTGSPGRLRQALEDLDSFVILEPRTEAPPPWVLARRFAILGLGDFFLDFAGRRPPGDPIHRQLAMLHPGDLLAVRLNDGGTVELLDGTRLPVAALSQGGRKRWTDALSRNVEVRVLALVERRKDDSEPRYQVYLRCERWHVPLVEICYREAPAGPAEKPGGHAAGH